MAGPAGFTIRPWGWWLRVNGSRLEDRDGRSWSSVREAYWKGSLGFPPVDRMHGEQQEMLLRVLESVEARFNRQTENRNDVFGGDLVVWRFYMCWLASVGLTETGGPPNQSSRDPFAAPLSDEGRSVLLMLQATRDPHWEAMTFQEILAMLEVAKRTPADEARERALRLFEQQMEGLPFVFAREMVGRSPVVTLTGFGLGARMPTARVMWSQSFGDAVARDDFFAWLADRVDRWEDWGKLAYRRGQAALTEHLLALVSLR